VPAPLFDAIVIVDWSANSTPKRGVDSIWVHRSGREPVNPRTRHEAAAVLAATLHDLAGRRVLVGVDFALGYPAGFARAAGLAGGTPAWESIWTHLADSLLDDHRNRNNRWQVAAELNARLGALQFWGVPPARASEHLTATRPPSSPLPRLRRTEEHVRSATGRPPSSVWQLLGVGSVGSQSLTGIPMLEVLRRDPALGRRVLVWPFETGFTTEPSTAAESIVIAEVWPSMVTLDPDDHPVKDAQQVIALSRQFARLDAAGELAPRFAPAITDDIAALAVAEEGWVLHASPLLRG